MSFKTGILMTSAASLIALHGCNSNDPTKMASPVTGPVAATVNGTAISESRVSTMVKQNAAQGRPENAELRKGVIEHLAMQLILSQEAAKKGLDKTPDVSEQLDLVRQSILATAFVQDYVKSHPVSDDMLKAEYEKIKGQMSGTEYRARHILVDRESEAKDIIAKLNKNPAAFEALAKEKSKDPGSKANGGDLGWLDPRGMVPEFGTAITKLAKGKFTAEPIKSQFGFHVILLEDSRTQAAPTFDQVKPMLQQQVMQQDLKKLLDGMKAKAKIEIVPAATPVVAIPAPAAKDGKSTGTESK